jgi:type II secretory pathway component PulM
MFSVSCPQCSCKMKAPEGLVGRKAKCGKCGHKFLIAVPESSGDGPPTLKSSNTPPAIPQETPSALSAIPPLPGTHGVAPPRRPLARGIVIGAAFALVLAIVWILILRRVKGPTQEELRQLAELKDKRDRVAAEYEAAEAERDRLAPAPGLDSPEKVRRYYEGRARIEEAKESVHEVEDERIRADAFRRIQQRLANAGDDESPLAGKMADEKIMREAETAIYERKRARKMKALAAAQKAVEETKKKNAARERAASEVNRLRGELDTIERQIEELQK